MNEPLEADEVIDMLNLAPMPDEGGMYTEIWTTEAGSAIYFLARPGDFSAMHRLNRTELWHHYAGAPLQLILLDPDGSVRRPIRPPSPRREGTSTRSRSTSRGGS